jgi:peptidoglycan/xylan/chitin deacetylase (PgdA/CDA1 family)
MLEKNLNNFFSKKKNTYTVFLFHGVLDKNKYQIRNYTKKHIEKKYFIDILKTLKNIGNCLSLNEILYRKENKINLPKNCFAITFDDGFENNYSIAAPLLDEFKLYSTFYFSTDFVNNNSMSWIDKVEYCFEKTKISFLLLPWNKLKTDISSTCKKIKVLNEIRFIIKKNIKYDIDQFVNFIFEELKIKKIKSLNTSIDKKINWKQVIEMKKNKYFSIGGHGHQHISLPSFTEHDMQKEISASLELFYKKAKIKLKHYSYPEGQKIDFNPRVINLLKKSGIKCCPTAIDGFNSLNTNAFKIKRIVL